jgi:trimethylamine:corrinoid methyltransferase-like protein
MPTTRGSALVDLSDDALAVDAIDEIARGECLFLAHPHTSQHFRKALWLPPFYIERRNTSEREHAGEPQDLLSEEVTRVLSSHKPKELPPTKIKQIDEYTTSI